MPSLNDLNFDNRYARLPSRFFQSTLPEPLPRPADLVALSPEAAQLLDLDLTPTTTQQLLEVMTGHQQLPGSEPLAMKYAGHQFGDYNPDLGDGRGLLLGEVTNRRGEHWELHLKGAGRTAYSRFGDGRAVLRSSIREFLASEALYHLGIPSTRALALVKTSESIQREQLEPGATLLRLTASHLRFGHFEHFYYRQDTDGLEKLLAFALEHFFPEAATAKEPAAALFDEVVKRTALLVARWQALGFSHGVLNTDNMSLLGETLDYGPFAFLDFYQPAQIVNRSDDRGRYAFERQPEIVHWNLTCLTQTLVQLAPLESLKASLQRFYTDYQTAYYQQLGQRLGLSPATDEPLMDTFIKLCEKGRLDWTCVLRLLAENRLQEAESLMKEPAIAVTPQAVDEWLQAWERRTGQLFSNTQERSQALQAHNPWVLPRTHLLQRAITRAEQGDFSEVRRQLDLYRQPFDARQRQAEDWLPPSARQLSPSLSCSS